MTDEPKIPLLVFVASVHSTALRTSALKSLHMQMEPDNPVHMALGGIIINATNAIKSDLTYIESQMTGNLDETLNKGIVSIRANLEYIEMGEQK